MGTAAKNRHSDDVSLASGFVAAWNADDEGGGAVVPMKVSPAKCSNEQTIEPGAAVIPVLVSAVVDILTVGAIAPHRSAIRRHLSDRALDAAIAKLQSIRRE